MTAFDARSKNQKPTGNNIKERRVTTRRSKREIDAAAKEFEAAGFVWLDWNKWSYTQEGGEFPVFRLVPGAVGILPGWVAICDSPEKQIPIGIASAQEIKIKLDAEILAIMRHAAAIQDAPLYEPAGEWIPF